MSTRRALFFSFLDRYAALALSILSSMVLARLLSPAELGVFSVTMVMIAFIASLRDLGAGQYLVQEKELTPQKVQAVWTVTLGTGALLAVVVLLAAHPVALFYEEPRVVHIMYVIALNFLLNPFGSITYAWLMREMRFETLAVMRFGGSLAGACASIFLAWQGHGPISLALGNLVATVVNALLAVRFRPAHFSWRPSFVGLRKVVAFGSKISATSLVGNIGYGAPELFLGKLQGMAAAGLYSRSNGLAYMFQRLLLDATQSVALPMFSRTHREQGNVEQPFLRAVSYITALGWAFFIGLALMSFPLTRLLYGTQWDDSAELTRILALGMAVGLPAAVCPQVIMGVGRPGQMLRTMSWVVAGQVCCIGVGSFFGLLGAGIGFAVSQILTVCLWLSTAKRLVGFRWRPLLATLRDSALPAALAALAPLASVWLFGLRPAHLLAPLLLSALGGVLLFACGALWLNHPISAEVRALVERARGLVRRAG
jgi:O-antigen/teichoic acid export membrane protein